MTLQIKKYVLGLVFWRDQVALIWKTKGPSYVLNTWNGIGGKVEPEDLTLEAAMAREFCEETGLFVGYDLWDHFATQTGINWDGGTYELHSFVAHLPDDHDFSAIKNDEVGDEEVRWWPMSWLNTSELLTITPNLKWIIPLALDRTTGYLEIKEN